MTSERLSVTPAPSPAALAQLQPQESAAHAHFEFGVDPLGTARLLITLTHDNADVVAQARQAWLNALRAAGLRAFIV